MRALVVSEDPAEREWVEMALGPGWEVELAADGRKALRRDRAEPFDVVIADETSQPYGAFGLSRELNFLDDPPAVIILLERAQDAWLAKWSQADRWLLRPVDPFDLSEAVRELVGEPDAGAASPSEPTVEAVPGA